MKNEFSRRTFLKAAGVAAFAVAAGGMLTACSDKDYTVPFGEDAKTSVATVQFTRVYSVYIDADTVNNRPAQWFVHCNMTATAAAGKTLELTKDNIWFELDGEKVENISIGRSDAVVSSLSVTVGDEPVKISMSGSVTGGRSAKPKTIVAHFSYQGTEVKTTVTDVPEWQLK